MEASYRSTDKQKFKAPFDVKETSEESVGRGYVEARRGVKAQRRISQGTSDVLGSHRLEHVQCSRPSCVVRLKPNKTSSTLGTRL